MSNAEGTGLSEEELFEVFGLEKTRSARQPKKDPNAPPKLEQLGTIPRKVSATEVPEIDVWPLIRKTELALRKCIREALVERYGSNVAGARILSHLGTEDAAKISQQIEQNRKRYSRSPDEFIPSDDPLDFTYLKQMMVVVAREWPVFQPIFKDRGFIDGKISEIATVRNDEAHFRGIPPIEKMRAYVACSDVLARLRS